MHPVERRVIHLRRLMLIHGCCYYDLNDTLVSDEQWQSWAWELAELQDGLPLLGFYDDAFRDWDGSTGYHLRYDADVRRVALRLLEHLEC